MKKEGPKADPRRGGAVRRGMPRQPGAGEALELQGKGRKTGVGEGEAKKRGRWYCRNGRMQGKELEAACEPPQALQSGSSCQYLLSNQDSRSNF